MNFTTLKAGWDQLSLISKVYSVVFVISGFGACASVFTTIPHLAIFETIFVFCIWVAAVLATGVILRHVVSHPTSLSSVGYFFVTVIFGLFGAIAGAALLAYIFQATSLSAGFFFQVASAITLLGTALATALTDPKKKREE